VLVFRSPQTPARSAELLQVIDRLLGRIEPAPRPPPSDVLELLLRLGELEAAVADARHPERDESDAVVDGLRGAAKAAGALLWHTSHPDLVLASDPVPAIRSQLQSARSNELPPIVDLRPAEGLTDEAATPEAYQDAALEFANEWPARRFTCIGLRTPGSTLGPAIAGALEATGRDTVSFTVRPRGSAFDPTILWTPRLAAEVAARSEGIVLIIDAGQSRRGSALISAAAAVEALGIRPEQIVLCSAWEPDIPGSVMSDPRWSRYPHLVPRFEQTWLESGRLANAAGVGTLVDVSGGGWRRYLLASSRPWPAVQPHHERRKYLAPEQGTLLKFVGLGSAGERSLEQSARVAAAGFGPVPAGLVHGFLVQPFLTGAPLQPGTREPGLILRLADYLAWLSREQRIEPATVADLSPVIELNSAPVIRKSHIAALKHRLGPGFQPLERPTRLDARMFPHEWLRTAQGLLKTDSVEHHDDPFYPGPHDIAWDVAGTCFEFRLKGQERQELIGACRRASGDQSIAGRLPWFALAYLAFRVGYTRLAAETLRIGEDADRFRRSILRYTALIRMELADSSGAAWRG
jgi:hypothetical protein